MLKAPGELRGLRIQRFTSTGDLLNMWGEPGEEPGRFVGIRGLAVAPWGEVYVSDVHTGTGEPAWIQVFTSGGEFIRSFWHAGGGPDDVYANFGLEIGPDSLLFVMDVNKDTFVFFRDAVLTVIGWKETAIRSLFLATSPLAGTLHWR